MSGPPNYVMIIQKFLFLNNISPFLLFSSDWQIMQSQKGKLATIFPLEAY